MRRPKRGEKRKGKEGGEDEGRKKHMHNYRLFTARGEEMTPLSVLMRIPEYLLYAFEPDYWDFSNPDRYENRLCSTSTLDQPELMENTLWTDGLRPL